MNLKHNEVQYFSTLSFDGMEDLKQALVFLNNKMDEITRQVSFWDVYNVTQVLLSDYDLVSKLALLNTGESAIVNANMLNDGVENHYRGDVAYRQIDGNILWIPAENKGIYKPTITYNAQTGLNITYSYQNNPDPDFTMTIDMQSQNAYLINGKVRDLFTNSNLTLNAIYANTALIRPIVRFYRIVGTQEEDFYPDWHWSISGSTITITLDATLHSSLINDIYIRVR